MAEVTTYHIGANPQIYEPSRNNCFQFIINNDLNNLLMAGIDESVATDNDYLTNVQEIIKISVVESSVPHFKIDPLEIRRGNSVVKFAGLPSFDAGTLKLDDFVGARTKDILLAWQARAYNVLKDTTELAANYKFDCDLVEYNINQTKIIRRWKLIGCWISGINEDNFNKASGDNRTLTADIQYDRAIPQAVID